MKKYILSIFLLVAFCAYGTVTLNGSASGSASSGSSLPDQSGNSGKFLTTDATSASWSTLTNAPTATALASNPSDCSADTYATTIAASGNLTCATVTNAGLAGSIAASKLVGSDITTVGTVATGTWSATTIALNKGGTGQTSKAAAFDALQPMTTAGDIIYGGASGTGTRLAAGSAGYFLTQGSGAPVWATAITDTSAVNSFNPNTRLLYRATTGFGSIDWDGQILYGADASHAFDYGTRSFVTSNGTIASYATVIWTFASGTSIALGKTITAGGTTTVQTINRISGRVNLAAAESSKSVTDSLVSTTSLVFATAQTNDATCEVKNVVPGSGSFVITMSAACTAETAVAFLVTN